jgi:hypothetical protein
MRRLAIALPTLLILGLTSTVANAYDGDWKRGRVYYRGVCTNCHSSKGATFAPNQYTKAEWTAYLTGDKHAKGADTVKQYVSAAYRTSIKDANKVAEKFLDAPDAELMEDIKAFVMNGAKDGESPASCN